jgi:hypothetical protein
VEPREDLLVTLHTTLNHSVFLSVFPPDAIPTSRSNLPRQTWSASMSPCRTCLLVLHLTTPFLNLHLSDLYRSLCQLRYRPPPFEWVDNFLNRLHVILGSMSSPECPDNGQRTVPYPPCLICFVASSNEADQARVAQEGYAYSLFILS